APRRSHSVFGIVSANGRAPGAARSARGTRRGQRSAQGRGAGHLLQPDPEESMKTIWETAAQRELSDRLLTLSADRRALWGKMSAQQMVCPLTESLKMALGELPVAPKNLPLRYPPLKQLVIYLAPFPKNAPTAPELVIAATPNEWARDVRTLTTLMDRFAARGPAGPWVDHPAFGRLSPRAGGGLVYRHRDPPLSQFR